MNKRVLSLARFFLPQSNLWSRCTLQLHFLHCWNALLLTELLGLCCSCGWNSHPVYYKIDDILIQSCHYLLFSLQWIPGYKNYGSMMYNKHVQIGKFKNSSLHGNISEVQRTLSFLIPFLLCMSVTNTPTLLWSLSTFYLDYLLLYLFSLFNLCNFCKYCSSYSYCK